MNGVFTISLDFELYWGMFDKISIEDYRENLEGVPLAVDRMLTMFENYDIHATWAVVGFLFYDNINALSEDVPDKPPAYRDQRLSAYHHMHECPGLDDRFHFAPGIIRRIKDVKGQEVGTHTFSHYYCLEDGQTILDFENDISRAVSISERNGVDLRSIVFPRNQVKREYLPVLEGHGIRAYRGNPESWLYQPVGAGPGRLLRRGLGLMDSYVNISGNNTSGFPCEAHGGLMNIPASRFLRPYSRNRAFLEPLRIRRITRGIEDAAKQGKLYHLWWHPHNFGKDLDENMAVLGSVLESYRENREKYGMMSLNMAEIGDRCSHDGRR